MEAKRYLACYSSGFILGVMEIGMRIKKQLLTRMIGPNDNYILWIAVLLKDEQWCLYALNCVQRRRNQTQGSWFVENWMKNEQILNVGDLKEKLKGKDTKFVGKIQNFSSSVPVSDSYWRKKRSKLLSSINPHIEENNGAPSLFITVSCV
jgi:hypothetical protein